MAKKFWNKRLNLPIDKSPPILSKHILKIGKRDLLLVETSKKDKFGNSLYLGTVLKRGGLFKEKIKDANHFIVRKF